jgi:hypothetical protein
MTALSLAQEVGDARLAGWVRGTQAQIVLYTGGPREAVTFAQAGTQVAPIGSAAMFRACALEARTQARRGDLGEAERALSRAEQALAARSAPQTGSFFSFDAPYLPYYAGTAYAWLGETARARTWASQAISGLWSDPLTVAVYIVVGLIVLWPLINRVVRRRGPTQTREPAT